ncbi:MAG: CDP-diacylglycerol--serine O-phosphatidyltransferase [Candidatus Magnetobacterium sp. LHC-1]|uniref:CDP-diacylglycerol--serine O-phosphatidyltransferase n=1 Tax=Candidatus Magnetobacterium casense TaxID=1455061 RepID=A0ABS6RU30_9BACT|nr:CDP-diacylglycerol--serine O-phosphatidyltransferase [Candidatus Magnetobacterium casensis]MBF0608138.1 CDP-diacylglycerol--serine O-phosphatidyltransferase [Nitrospirota bacterium]MBV6340127.1 CDP-diacylglycerol--serine O-phosphatidyltransferase [Candidatus Magnetobacterium casensis]
MKKGVYILPNALTLCGMCCGFYAIVASMRGQYVDAGTAIIIANIFDGLDGWVARLTNSASKFGIELDSLSDLVAFGVAPAVVAYDWALKPLGRIGWAVAFLYVCCGALRLARYNVQMVSTEKKYFTGMPIPAAATILVTFIIFHEYHFERANVNSIMVAVITFVLSIFMISTLRFHGLKELDLKKRKPFPFLVLLIIMITIIIMNPPVTLFVFGFLYMFIGIIENIYLLYTRKKRAVNLITKGDNRQ